MKSHCTHRFVCTLIALMGVLGFCAGTVVAYAADQAPHTFLPAVPSEPNLFALPGIEGPVGVSVGFELRDINEINDEAETFEFTGVLTTSWLDPRQAFDPAAEGVKEKIYTGAYQFNEIAPGWYPQIVLVNQAGALDKNGVLLRVLPDGTSILIETLNAVAESEFKLTRYPFDEQRLEAVFEILGLDAHEVQLKAEPGSVKSVYGEASVPQWDVRSTNAYVRTYTETGNESKLTSSAFVMSLGLERKPFYLLRLVVLPLMVIVLLSFSVFWMERSSLGDRISVSFIGILTAVSYQIVMGDSMPRIAYFTLIHGFMYFSFVTMCATVVINLFVGALDKKGQSELGDLIDLQCRWIFPLAYFGILMLMLVTAFVFY